MKPLIYGLMGLCLLTIGLSLFACKTEAVTGTDFSGTWKADLDRSRLVDGAPNPISWTVIIQHNQHRLMRTETFVGQDGKASGATMSFTTDGKENRNLVGDRELITKCRWEGPSLIIEGVMKLGPNEQAVWKEKLTLSPDGGSLHATSTVIFPGAQPHDADVYLERSKK